MALEFEDYYGASGRANTPAGFYLVSPESGGGYRARKSNGVSWIWDGGSFISSFEAEKACRTHAGENENIDQQSRLAADINETIRAFAALEELPLHIAKQALEDAMSDVENVLMKGAAT